MKHFVREISRSINEGWRSNADSAAIAVYCYARDSLHPYGDNEPPTNGIMSAWQLNDCLEIMIRYRETLNK